MNHVFFNTSQKVSANPCTVRASVHQGKRKHGRPNPNLKQWWSFFFRHPRDCSRGLGAWRSDSQPGLIQGGFDKTSWKGEKKKTWNVGTSTALTWPSPIWPFFFLYKDQKIKSALKGTRFESVDTVKAKATELMNKLSEDDLQHCSQQWKIRMERLRDREGECIDGDCISIV